MRLDSPAALRLLDVLATEWTPTGNCIESKDLSSSLPHRPTVYLLTRGGAGGEIVYTGQTQDLKVRMAQHASNPRMVTVGYDTINWFDPGIPDLSTRLQIETMLISAFLPMKNKAIFLILTKAGKLAELRFGCRGALGRAIKGASKVDNDQPWANQSGAMR